jgi:hypothetical protein
MEVCKTTLPVQTEVNEGHVVAYHLYPRKSKSVPASSVATSAAIA